MIRKREKEVVIAIRSGVATPLKVPRGIRVKIVDYDVEGLDLKHITKYDGEDANVTNY